ncbi:type II secretion system F family protein [Aggregatibacter actinomycetemcomitans]|uniref:Flp pilus assembly protein n=1 Tax=Aggregatibacter actinomycetemcomitans serotype e str. SC1083 TaxID=907488 RepID=G4A8T5_AGGAC|nr:type II secretion system F family protein [Aggregatibacter actinomycetemcomitans]ACX82153.1 pilus assembly protein TadC [Aggregatibacter actinomycetemcomitans D11S-1]EGY33834.1 Flp pilus assembly protein [Aggregatibacter actinomycetemcomitans serotype e str. SC1083]KOE59571.1 pilus assembly protein TadC [Aggregatibacter actinomycetemcomitans serotype c str. SCC2302]KOE61336.1 pilus assembly protein TadC [Aggregatibacter actinomycetemcomitans serotype c str. AAS4A]KOE63064.1 pilus assembly p
MMIKLLLSYALLTIFGIIVLFAALSARKKFQYRKEVITGERPKDQDSDEVAKNKSKQQIELELLLINNNPILKVLGIIDKNIKVKLLIMLLLFGVYYLYSLTDETTDSSSLLLGFLTILIITIVIPGVLIGSILKAKIKKIMNDLAGFIDLVAVNVQTGISIEAALKQVATDFKTLNPDLTYVMLRIIRKSEITGMSQALQDLSVSLPTTEIRMFCTVMQQSLNFGSSIYHQLIQLSTDIREIQLLAIEEKLGTLSAKMSIPLILFIMFPIIILILAPGVMRVFPHVF